MSFGPLILPSCRQGLDVHRRHLEGPRHQILHLLRRLRPYVAASCWTLSGRCRGLFPCFGLLEVLVMLCRKGHHLSPWASLVLAQVADAQGLPSTGSFHEPASRS